MSLLDVLCWQKKRRELSADEFVRAAIRAEAAGDGESIDPIKLESMLTAIGMSITGENSFETEVKNERRSIELRKIVAGGKEASVRLHHAIRAENEAKEALQAGTARLQADVDAAFRERIAADHQVREVRAAEQELRQLVSDDLHSRRTDLKQRRGFLLQRGRELRLEIAAAEKELQRKTSPTRTILSPDGPQSVPNAEAKDFHNAAERAEFIAARQAKIDALLGQVAEVDRATEEVSSQLEVIEKEVIGGDL